MLLTLTPCSLVLPSLPNLSGVNRQICVVMALGVHGALACKILVGLRLRSLSLAVPCANAHCDPRMHLLSAQKVQILTFRLATSKLDGWEMFNPDLGSISHLKLTCLQECMR